MSDFFIPRAFAVALAGLLAVNASAETELSFDEALRLATTQNLSVRRADETLVGARAQETQGSYAHFPTLSGTLKRSRSGAADADRAASRGASSVGVESTLSLYKFGADTAIAEASAARAAEAAFNRVDAAGTAEAEAAEALLDVIARRKERDLAAALLKARRENLAMAEKLYERGLRPAQDVDKVRIDAANEDVSLRESEEGLSVALVRLKELAGRSLDVKPAWPWIEYFRQLGAPKPVKAPALGERADRKALAERVRALDADARATRASGIAALDAQVDLFWTRDDESAKASRQWSGALVLSVPLFDRLVSSTNYRVQERQKALAEIDLIGKDRTLEADWAAANASFTSALAGAETREQTLALARKLFDKSLKSFQAGVLSANELSLDQDRLIAAELNTLKGWSTAHRSFVKLCRAQGQALAECLRRP